MRTLYRNGAAGLRVVVCAVLFGCGGNSHDSEFPKPVGPDIPTVQGTVQVTLPATSSVDASSLTITNGLIDEAANQGTGETPLAFNASAAQLVTASQGDVPLLMGIAVTPRAGDRAALTVESTAASLIYLQPFVAQVDPEDARIVLDAIKTLPETQELADILRQKMQSPTPILWDEDPDVTRVVDAAVQQIVELLPSLLPSQKSEKVSITPTGARSGLTVTADTSDAIGPHTITVENRHKRYVAAYLETSTGTVLDFTLIDGKTSLFGFTVAPAVGTLAVNTTHDPDAILKIYGLGFQNVPVWWADPEGVKRTVEPAIATAVFEVTLPVMITIYGAPTFQGAVMGSFYKNLLENIYLELRNDETIRTSIMQSFGETVGSGPLLMAKEVLKRAAKMAVDAMLKNRQGIVRSALQTAGVTDQKTYTLAERLGTRVGQVFKTVSRTTQTTVSVALEAVPVVFDISQSALLETYAVQDLRAGQKLYGVDLVSRLFTFNVTTKAVQIIGPLGSRSLDIARAPNGDLFAESAGSLVRIDPMSGAATNVGAMGFMDVNSLAFRSDGTLFGATASGEFLQIDTTTGAATRIGSLGNGLGAWGDLAFAPDGTLFGTTYFIDGSPSGIFLMRINPTTGQADNIGPIGFSSVFGLAFTADGLLYGGDSDTGTILRIDPTTGTGIVYSTTSLPSIAGLAS
jgi:hypothetical protein